MTVQDLESSLEFSQQEIESLKKENADLKKKMGVLEIEDKRKQFQATAVEDKLDRLETLVKKKNLLIEGVPEPVDQREDIENTVGGLFDELSVGKGISFEACYRMGTYNRNRSRPIMVSFEKQADKYLVYARRMELRSTAHFRRVWFFGDLGALSTLTKLLNSGDLELVEATPHRLWGCGATISSNVLRKHEWPGQNKHGEILMTVRDELRLLGKA